MTRYGKWFPLMLIGLIAPQHAFAQLAPTGSHYAGRPSDTGYGGTVTNATGTFAAAIPRVRFKVMRLCCRIEGGLAHGGGETERRGVFGNS